MRTWNKIVFSSSSEHTPADNELMVILDRDFNLDFENVENIIHHCEIMPRERNVNSFPKYLHHLQKLVYNDKDGTSIIDLLSYNNHSLWYLIEYWMFYEHINLTLTESISRALYTHEVITKVLEKNSAKVIEVHSYGTVLCTIIQDVLLQKKIDFKTKRCRYYNKPNWKNNNILLPLYFKSRLKVRRFKSVTEQSSYDTTVKNIFVGVSRNRTDQATNHSIYGNICNYYENKSEPYNIIEIDELTRHPLNSIRFFEKNRENVSNISSIYNKNKSKYFKDIKVKIKKRLQSVQNSGKTFVYDNYDYSNIFYTRLNFIINNFLDFMAENLSNAKILCENNHTNFIIQHPELYLGKCLIMHRQENQKVLSLTLELLYPSGCLSRHVQVATHKRPIPDLICAYGLYAKNVLVNNCNMPENIIKITGPQFTGFNKDLNIIIEPSNKQYTIAVTISKTSEDFALFRKILQSANLRKNYNFILKVHPSVDEKYFEREVQRTCIHNNVQVVKNIDINVVIAQSDLLISLGSTVIMNAFLLHTPVILPERQICPNPYSTYNSVESVPSFELLLPTIDKYAQGYDWKVKHGKGIKRFIHEYLNDLKNNTAQTMLTFCQKGE